MKGGRFIVASGLAALLSACANAPERPAVVAGGAYTQVETRAARPDESAERIMVRDDKGAVVVQKVPFRIGVSSATVERLARQSGCQLRTGAGLLTEKGPMEVYRLQCEDGSHYLAQCELRQCQPMRR